MKVIGTATLHAPAGQVWAALSDPAVLVRTIPGCERLEVSGPDSYRMTVTAGVASVKGTYAGEICLFDRNEPTSFLMKASGAGSPGTVSTSVRVRLADGGDGSTRLSYDADAVVGGMIAGVGQRMLTSVAKRMAEEFFSSVDGVLTGAVTGVASADGVSGGAQASDATSMAGVAEGVTGSPGVAGPVGVPGVAGPAGVAGVAGPAGVPGVGSLTGLPGVAGPAGVAGVAGPAGGPGVGGPAGVPGVAGPAGAPGPDGPAGQAQPGVFVAPPRRPPALAGGQGFLRGVLVGAALALAGVAIGGLLGRRNR